MAIHGRLTLQTISHTMPADAPAYQAPPYYYKNVQAIGASFETDPDAAAAALPAPLSLREPATAALAFFDYPWSTFGPYKEAILSLSAEHNGKPMVYIQQVRGRHRAADAGRARDLGLCEEARHHRTQARARHDLRLHGASAWHPTRERDRPARAACAERDQADHLRKELAVLGPGERVKVSVDQARPARFILVAGKPLNEPVVKYGPFVMNTPDEIRQAVVDYQSGKF